MLVVIGVNTEIKKTIPNIYNCERDIFSCRSINTQEYEEYTYFKLGHSTEEDQVRIDFK